ncbi:MAG: type II toxin-antitoxin system VapC family toxin [Planctomycetes bacterium]|nr:type II toxin-antitoxin system VapC family toxin [Planctomycetota bacterium]
MRYLLDTSICVDIIRRRAARAATRLRSHDPGEVGLSSITLAELEYGVARSSDPQRNRIALAKTILPLSVLPFDHWASAAYGRIRADLERAGTPIGPLDTLIAAHARSLNVTLVTSNEREFRRVKGLRVQNWGRRD